jgi:transcriptional regulator with XRE-family HTH domain
MTCKHPVQPVADPWWDWCETCYAEARAIVSRPDPRPVEDIPPRERCAFCLTVIVYGEARRFAKHQDCGEQCRGSGLAGYVALGILDAIVARMSIRQYAASQRRHPGRYVPPSNRPERNHRASVEITNDLVSTLVNRRAALGASQADMAKQLNAKACSVCEWEKSYASPKLSKAIAWAQLLGFDLALKHKDGRPAHLLVDASFANRVLFAERKAKNMTVSALAVKIGLSKERRETDTLDLKLDSFAEWAHVLDFELELVPNG